MSIKKIDVSENEDIHIQWICLINSLPIYITRFNMDMELILLLSTAIYYAVTGSLSVRNSVY